MAVQIAVNDLAAFRLVNSNKDIGVTFSCWDLLHAGHHLFLADSKNNCDILCVGLQTDPTLDRPEKNTPIQSLEEREIQLKSSRYVDYYFIYDTEKSLYNVLLALDPNVRFLGDDYVGKTFTGCDLPIHIFFHPRSNHTFSTTALRKKIYEKEAERIAAISYAL
jgi:glycerol-3-phosphate cytidylyltransferase